MWDGPFSKRRCPESHEVELIISVESSVVKLNLCTILPIRVLVELLKKDQLVETN